MRKLRPSNSLLLGANSAIGNLCYTDSMQDDSPYWDNWARILHNLGVTRLAASVLEGFGPLRLVAAQLIHAGTPILGNPANSNQWQALADMLEDRKKSDQFISFLKGEDTL